MKLLLLTVAWIPCFAQVFEVASIRPHEGQTNFMGRTIQGTQVNFTAVTARGLISDAYELRDVQLEGGPGWIRDTTYDIRARVAGDAAPPLGDVRKMMQALLTDRFQLKFHRVQREVPVYALVQAKGGSKLKENPEGNGGYRMRSAGGDAPAELIASGAPMTLVVPALAANLRFDRPVIDRTGLSGKYDFTLLLKIDRATQATVGPDGESAFTLLEEQLGLKLEPERQLMDIVVIDSVERPSEN